MALVIEASSIIPRQKVEFAKVKTWRKRIFLRFVTKQAAEVHILLEYYAQHQEKAFLAVTPRLLI